MDTIVELHFTDKIAARLPRPFIDELAKRTVRKIQKEGWKVGDGGIQTLYSHYKLLLKNVPVAVTVATSYDDDGTLVMLVGEEEELRELVPTDDNAWLERFKGDKARPERFEWEDGQVVTRPMASDGAHRIAPSEKNRGDKG